MCHTAGVMIFRKEAAAWITHFRPRQSLTKNCKKTQKNAENDQKVLSAKMRPIFMSHTEGDYVKTAPAGGVSREHPERPTQAAITVLWLA